MSEPIYPMKFSKKKKLSFLRVFIPKIVRFTEIQDTVFNLGFGDFDEKSTKYR
jgi:hypothetical protein